MKSPKTILLAIFILSSGNSLAQPLPSERAKQQVASIVMAKAWCHTKYDGVPAEISGQNVVASLMKDHQISATEGLQLMRSTKVQRLADWQLEELGCDFLRFKIDY